MQFNCRRILDALASPSSEFNDEMIIDHIENCRSCRDALNLPEKYEITLQGTGPSRAPDTVFENIMRIIRIENGLRPPGVLAEITTILPLVGMALLLILLIFIKLDNLIEFGQVVVENLSSSEVLNYTDAIRQLAHQIQGILKAALASQLFLAAGILTVSITWTFAIIRLRDTLKS
jgi:hypothetical protein